MSALGELWSLLTTADRWTGPNGLLSLTWAHVRLSVLATVAAVAVAVPAGVWLGHRSRVGAVATSVANVGRALPSFAVLVLAFSVFSEWGRGLTIWPTFVALVLLAIPPILTNVTTGVAGVDPRVRESASAMGMRPRQRLWRVEAPMALPLALTGVRVAAVQVIATATLGAWVGFQCLGTPIFEGFAQQDDGKILAGAVLVAALVVVAELGFSLLERVALPWRRPSGRRPRRPATMVATTSGRTAPGAGTGP